MVDYVEVKKVLGKGSVSAKRVEVVSEWKNCSSWGMDEGEGAATPGMRSAHYSCARR